MSPLQRRLCCEAADPVSSHRQKSVGHRQPGEGEASGQAGEQRGRRAPGWQPWHGRGRSRRHQRSVPSRGCRETWVSLEPALPCPAQPGDGPVGATGVWQTPGSAPQSHPGSRCAAPQCCGYLARVCGAVLGALPVGLGQGAQHQDPKKDDEEPQSVGEDSLGGQAVVGHRRCPVLPAEENHKACSVPPAQLHLLQQEESHNPSSPITPLPWLPVPSEAVPAPWPLRVLLQGAASGRYTKQHGAGSDIWRVKTHQEPSSSRPAFPAAHITPYPPCSRELWWLTMHLGRGESFHFPQLSPCLVSVDSTASAEIKIQPQLPSLSPRGDFPRGWSGRAPLQHSQAEEELLVDS